MMLLKIMFDLLMANARLQFRDGELESLVNLFEPPRPVRVFTFMFQWTLGSSNQLLFFPQIKINVDKARQYRLTERKAGLRNKQRDFFLEVHTPPLSDKA